MNINGFEVEKFNQYNLPEGKRQSTCPLCSRNRKKKTDKCLLVFWSIGLARCYHCNELIQIHTYKNKSLRTNYIVPKRHNNTKLPDNVVKWFEGRRISQFTLNIAKVSYGKEYMPQHNKEVETIQFNYFRDEKLVNVKYRSSDKKFKLHKGSELIFYNIDSIRTAKEVYITEGEIDCLSLMEIGIYNVVSVPNGATTNSNLKYLDNCIEYFENKEKVYLFTDNDEPGIELRKEFIRRLGADKCYIFNYDEKDVNEALVKGKDYLRNIIDSPIEFPLENVVTVDQIKDLWIDDEKKGFIIGFAPFDAIFSTYLGQFITVTGIPTHGKSDFVDQMIAGYALNYDWPIAVASPENIPPKIHFQKIWKKIAGKRAAKSEDEYNLILEWIKAHFYMMDFENGFDLLTILAKAKELIKRKGIKCLVIDPYNKAPYKEAKALNGSVEYTRDYLFLIDEFARLNNILIILVAHPRKPVMGVLYEPSFYDIKGGTEFYDMSPHGLLVHRDFDNETVKVKVLKCKFQNLGVNNAEIIVGWNPYNGRYSELNSSPTSTGIICDNTNWLDTKEQANIQLGIEPDFEPLSDDMPF